MYEKAGAIFICLSFYHFNLFFPQLLVLSTLMRSKFMEVLIFNLLFTLYAYLTKPPANMNSCKAYPPMKYE